MKSSKFILSLILTSFIYISCSSSDYLINLPPSIDKLVNTSPELDTSVDSSTTLPDVLKLTTRDCVNLALQRNVQCLSAKIDELIAEEKITEAIYNYLPELTITGNYRRLDEVPVAEIEMAPGVTQSFQIGDKNNYKVEALIQQPIFTGFRNSTILEMAKLGLKNVQKKEQIIKEVITFRALQSYYNLLYAKEVFESAKKNYELAKKTFEDFETMYNQGLASEFQLLRSKVFFANMEAIKIQSENGFRNAKMDLLRVMNVPLDKEVVLLDPLKPSDVVLDRQKLLDMALKNRRDYQIIEQLIDIQKLTLTMVKSTLYPNIYLGFAFGYERPSKKDFFGISTQDYWAGTAILTWPISDIFKKNTKLTQTELEIKKLTLQKDDLIEQIKYDIEKAIADVISAKKFVKSQMQNVETAEKSVKIAQTGVEQGINTQLELLDAEASLATARKNELLAIYRYNLAVLALKKAMGIIANGY